MTNRGGMWLTYQVVRVCDMALCRVKSESINCLLWDIWGKHLKLIYYYLERLSLKQEALGAVLNHSKVWKSIKEKTYILQCSEQCLCRKYSYLISAVLFLCCHAKKYTRWIEVNILQSMGSSCCWHNTKACVRWQQLFFFSLMALQTLEKPV